MEEAVTKSHQNGSSEVNQLLFSGQLNDWSVSEDLDIKYHLWNNELRIELSNHFENNPTVVTGAMLLDDNRLIRIRWNDIETSFWSESEWQNRTFLTLTNERVLSTVAGATAKIQSFECISEVPASDLTFTSLAIVNETGNNLTATFGFTNYQWYLNDVLISGENNNSLTNVTNGNYYVAATDSNGCLVISDVFTSSSLSINENEIDKGFKAYPNPSKDYFYLSAGNINNNKIRIFDTIGRDITNLIHLFIQSSELLKIDLSNQKSGLYMISVSGNTKLLVKL